MKSSLRRNQRLRKEFLFKKEEEARANKIYEKKKRIKTAIEIGKSIPTELRGEERELRNQISFDDDFTFNKTVADVDDEYINAGVIDPKICVTTSRDPSSKLKEFVKEVKLLFPNSERFNRGGTKMKDIVATALKHEYTDLIIVHENRGKPDAMTVTHLPHGPTATFTLYNVVTRHEILQNLEEKDENQTKKTMSEEYPHLIFDNFSTKLGLRVKNILKFLFPVPKVKGKETTRVMSFINREDFISFRHYNFSKKENVNNFEIGVRKAEDVELEEVGPRFEMQLFKISLGTVDQTEAEVEYIRRFYMNTSHKKKNLSTV